jgi:hypothetical protein
MKEIENCESEEKKLGKFSKYLMVLKNYLRFYLTKVLLWF